MHRWSTLVQGAAFREPLATGKVFAFSGASTLTIAYGKRYSSILPGISGLDPAASFAAVAALVTM